MRTAVQAGALSVLRIRPTFMAPVGVYTLTVAGISGLIALVTASERSGGNTGALAVFLVTTAFGLFAVTCSVFDVVRAGFDSDLQAMTALGSGAASARVFTATQSVCAFIAAIPAGLLLVAPAYVGLLTLLRVGGFHGVPTASPDWVLSVGIGVAVSLVVAAVGGWRAQPLRVHRPQESTRGRLGRAARLVVGAAAGCMSLVLLRVADDAGIGALFGAALLIVASAVLLAPAVFLSLCRAVRPFDRLTGLWPARLALSRARVFRLSSSVTVAAFALVLFSAFVSVVSGAEQLQRVAFARQLVPTTSVVTRADGSLAARGDAEAACRDVAGCAGMVYVAPITSSASGTAFTTPAVRRALFARPPDGVSADATVWPSPGDGLTGSPWGSLQIGEPPALPGAWRALPVFAQADTGVLRTPSNALRVQSARQWAADGPSESVVSGAGASDIAPMLAPLITVTFLFSAAAAYLLGASFHRTARTMSALGGGRLQDLASVAADAAVRSVAVYLLAWASWTLMARGVGSVAASRGLTVPVDGMPVALQMSFVVLFVVTTCGGALGARAGRRLS